MISDKLPESLSAAADLLSGVDRSLPGLVAPAGAFGAGGAGVPGRVSRELHEHWRAVVAARAREAADAEARLRDLADGVRSTARDYALTDETAARRIERESR
ncbi:type VII secretion target [Actinoplanes sp. NPDC051633]|uniref:type VII secretion target n=1 Tax=Actinoplanes sp. NPDC051633 TaxID=3155670 RepID=UPI0034181DD3